MEAYARNWERFQLMTNILHGQCALIWMRIGSDGTDRKDDITFTRSMSWVVAWRWLAAWIVFAVSDEPLEPHILRKIDDDPDGEMSRIDPKRSRWRKDRQAAAETRHSELQYGFVSEDHNRRQRSAESSPSSSRLVSVGASVQDNRSGASQNTLRLYQTHFEPHFLRTTEEYYRIEASRHQESDDISSYIQMVSCPSSLLLHRSFPDRLHLGVATDRARRWTRRTISARDHPTGSVHFARQASSLFLACRKFREKRSVWLKWMDFPVIHRSRSSVSVWWKQMTWFRFAFGVSIVDTRRRCNRSHCRSTGTIHVARIGAEAINVVAQKSVDSKARCPVQVIDNSFPLH